MGGHHRAQPPAALTSRPEVALEAVRRELTLCGGVIASEREDMTGGVSSLSLLSQTQWDAMTRWSCANISSPSLSKPPANWWH